MLERSFGGIGLKGGCAAPEDPYTIQLKNVCEAVNFLQNKALSVTAS